MIVVFSSSMIKQVLKKEEPPQPPLPPAEELPQTRQPSPELAKFSALITRPPKLKSSKNPEVPSK